MRSRRTRTRFQRIVPKPEIVIEERTAPKIEIEKLEPSRARERAVYEPSDEDNDIVRSVVTELMESIGLEFETQYEHADYQRVQVSVGDRQAGALIGKRGSGLEALELLLARMASHRAGHAVPVQVDVNEYRKRHEDELREQARACAEKVLESGEDEHLPPMGARDRRVVHVTVQEYEGLQTFSLGEGSTKHIVVHRKETQQQ